MPPPIRVELLAHDPAWAQLAQREADRLQTALADLLLTVHHIGSTAIAGICAKPILDLLPVVTSITALDAHESVLRQLGYEVWGEYGIAGRRYATRTERATGQRLVQLHSFEPDHPEIERHLAFRDYLRARSTVAAAYDAEKRRCQQLHPDDSHAYSDAKSAWIAGQMPAALAYYDPR